VRPPVASRTPSGDLTIFALNSTVTIWNDKLSIANREKQQ
jgi:hypothetical protein